MAQRTVSLRDSDDVTVFEEETDYIVWRWEPTSL
jgi:hypothetical protein